MKIQILLIALILLSGCACDTPFSKGGGLMFGCDEESKQGSLEYGVSNITKESYFVVDCSDTKVSLNYPDKDINITMKDVCDILKESK